MSKRRNKKLARGVKLATDEQISDIQESANNFYTQFSDNLMRDFETMQMQTRLSASNGSYQPILEQNMLQHITFNPMSATSTEVQRWLLNPLANDGNLRGLSQFLKNAVGQYQSLINYNASMLSFNYMVTDIGENNVKSVHDESYIESSYKAKEFVQSLGVKSNFNAMVEQTITDGISVWWIDMNEQGITFLPLPTDYVYVTSYWGNGWDACIDLMYFNYFIGLEKCIPELSYAYREFLEQRQKGLNGDKLAPFQYFPLPRGKYWVFTSDPNKPTKIPLFTSSMGSSLDVLAYKELLKDLSFLETWKVLVAKLPTKRSGDSFVLSYDEAARIQAMIATQIPPNISSFVTPFENTQLLNTNESDTIDKTMKMSNDSFYSSAGVSGAFFGLDTKSSRALEIGQTKDYQIISNIMYPQFTKMVNHLLSLYVPEYKWNVKFFGNAIYKKAEVELALQAVTLGNLPIGLLGATLGFEPLELENMINLEKETGIKSRLVSLVSQFNVGQSKDSIKEGRPSKDISQLSDEGISTRESRGV